MLLGGNMGPVRQCDSDGRVSQLATQELGDSSDVHQALPMSTTLQEAGSHSEAGDASAMFSDSPPCSGCTCDHHVQPSQQWLSPTTAAHCAWTHTASKASKQALPSALPRVPLSCLPAFTDTSILPTDCYSDSTDAKLDGCSLMDAQQHPPQLSSHGQQQPACPLPAPQLQSSDHSDPASILQHRHQLHMIDLMLARVTGAEEAMRQGIAVDAERIPFLGGTLSTLGPIEGSLKGPDVLAVDDYFGECNEPVTSQGHLSMTTGFSHQEGDSLSSLASSDISHCLYEGFTRERAQDLTGTGESNLASVEDCPGSSLVPVDWLADDSADIDMACPFPLVHAGMPMCTSHLVMASSYADTKHDEDVLLL